MRKTQSRRRYHLKNMKKILILSALFVATFGALIWIAIDNARITRAPILEGIKPNQIERLEISYQGKSVELEKNQKIWEVKKPEADLADQDAASQIAQALPSIILEDIATKNPASYSDYGISTSAAHLVAYAAISPKPILDGFFGRQAFGWSSAYFRYSNRPEIYITSGLNASRLTQDPDNFRERAFFPRTYGILKSIEVAPSRGKKYTLFPSSPTWPAVFGLRITEFVNQDLPRKDPFKKPLFVFKAQAGKQNIEWIIGSPKPVKSGKPLYYYARSRDRNIVALVSAYEINSLLPQKPQRQPRGRPNIRARMANPSMMSSPLRRIIPKARVSTKKP